MILLTGASGFVGKHLLSALLENYSASGFWAFTSDSISSAPFLLHNNYDFGKDYFVKAGVADSITTIIHAGAFTPKNSEQSNNWQLCNSNIFSTGKLLNATLPNVNKFIYLSTLDVYGNENVISELSPIEPVSLYGHSKMYGEKMIAAWANSENKIFQLLRLGHVYGPGEEAYQKIIPLTMKRIAENQTIKISGTGNEIRSFIFIQDVVKAILNSLQLEESIGPVNLVGSQTISILDVVKKIISITGKNVTIEMIPSTAINRNLVFDNRKMKQHVLSSETLLDEGLKCEWEYMRKKYA